MTSKLALFVLACYLSAMIFVVLADGNKREKESSGITFYGEAADKIINLLSDSCKCRKKEAKNRKIPEKEEEEDETEKRKPGIYPERNSCRVYVARPRDCSELHKSCKSGIYKIFPGKYPGFYAYCHVDKHGVGWTVFQRRMNGKIDFYRDWQSYKEGFGNLKEEFWLGNEHLHQVTREGSFTLRIDLEDFENNSKYAEYQLFSVSSESSGFKLKIGKYSGDAGNSLNHHNGMKFTTKDKDQDASSSSNCATLYKGGWWYGGCHYANLNGLYLKGKHKSNGDGVNWRGFKGYNYSMKKTVMMLKRI